MEPISPLSSSDEEAPIVEVKLKRLVECDDVNTPKRKRGRPKGSLNNNARSTISTKKQNDNDESFTPSISSPSSKNKNSPGLSPYAAGDLVQAKWNGKWYDAKIEKVTKEMSQQGVCQVYFEATGGYLPDLPIALIRGRHALDFSASLFSSPKANSTSTKKDKRKKKKKDSPVKTKRDMKAEKPTNRDPSPLSSLVFSHDSDDQPIFKPLSPNRGARLTCDACAKECRFSYSNLPSIDNSGNWFCATCISKLLDITKEERNKEKE